MRIGEVARSAGVNIETLRHDERRGGAAVRRAALGLLLAAAALAACRSEARKSPYTAVGAEASALRAAFNADAGKVRLVILVAPT